MHKLKRSKKHILELDPVIAAAIDKTVEAAISSKLEYIDSHITQTIKNCLDNKPVDLAEFKVKRRIYCPDAGP